MACPRKEKTCMSKEKDIPKTEPITGLPPHLAKVKVTIEWITPELSKSWLENSPDFNRGIGKRVVWRYTNAMAEKRWYFTGESIIFDSGEPGKETILDGWHRLTAIVESGVAGLFVVVRGVPKDAFHYIDHGRGRVFRDTLVVLGNPNASIVSAATAYLTAYLKAELRRFTTNGLEEHEKWRTYEDYGTQLNELQERYNRRLSVRVPGGLLIAVHIVLSKIDSEAADEFMDLVVLGDDLEPDHPVSQFRNSVRKHMDMAVRPTNLPTRFGAGLIKAWNLFRKEERVAKFMLPSTTPEPI
jgi:hypothetical protein